MKCNFGIFACFYILLTSKSIKAKGEIFTHLGQCCTEGSNWSEEKHHCNDYDFAIDKIPDVWRGLCLSAFGICCSKQLSNLQCAAGRAAARNSSNCEGNKEFNSTSYQNCCRACQIGLAVAASGNNCTSHFSMYLAHDESYEICCNEMNGSFILTENDDICGKFHKLCSHICENTEDSYVCKCPPGFKLDENRVTCTPEEGYEPNEIFGEEDDEYVGLHGGCRDGWTKNDDTDECEDIDECLVGTAICNADQYCHNTDGRYECLQIKSTSCPDGYRFNTNTEECEDINECLEEKHDCDETAQTCLNTRGSYTCQDRPYQECESGFIYASETGTCEDFDECLDNPCGEGYTCVNQPGSYECRKSTTAMSRGRHGPRHSMFSNYEICGQGYRFKHNKCIDIDECLTDKNACDSNQICINEEGGHRCECKTGFTTDPTTNACIDINECAINNHNCWETQRCDNTIGSYTCTRKVGCGTGYTLNAQTSICEDDDECSLGTENCPTGYICRNTVGSFRCDRVRPTRTTSTTTTTTTTTTTAEPTSTTEKLTTTTAIPIRYQHTVRPTRYYITTSRPYTAAQTYTRLNAEYSVTPSYRPDLPCGRGFQRNHLGACVDIDECRIPNSCPRHQRCINTNGSYRCQDLLLCSGGFRSSPDGKECIDIDECKTGENNCGPDQICRNKIGGYICSCPPGHALNQLNRCEDINECKFEHEQVCSTNSYCVNTIGSYECECKPGFKKYTASDKTCMDVDECQEMSGLCQQRCRNFWGSYRCACDQGYELNRDNRTCSDIDECEVHKEYHLCTGYCNNVPGSYQCSCPSGYELATDSRSCRDIDECQTLNICGERDEICTNIRGSYRCHPIHCPYGYEIDSNKKNLCKLINPICEGEECFYKPSSYTYNFITLVSKMLIPPEGRTLFTLRGSVTYGHTDFDLKISQTQAPPNIEKATDNHFSMRKLSQNEVELRLMRSLEGPQDVELELSMTVFMSGQPRGKSIAKIIIIVSEYTF